MTDVHLTGPAREARDVSDHGLLDADVDDARYERAHEWAVRNHRSQPPGYGYFTQWTPARCPVRDGEPF